MAAEDQSALEAKLHFTHYGPAKDLPSDLRYFGSLPGACTLGS
jgi:hypothetical protein